MYTRVAVDARHVVRLDSVLLYQFSLIPQLIPWDHLQECRIIQGKFGCGLCTLYIQVDVSAIDLPFQQIDGK